MKTYILTINTVKTQNNFESLESLHDYVAKNLMDSLDYIGYTSCRANYPIKYDMLCEALKRMV